MNNELSIGRRFRGPAQSGNGGYVAGMLAQALGGSVAVRLKAPPPLETRLRIEAASGQARLVHGDRVVAEARAQEPGVEPPPSPSFEDAERASRSSPVLFRHPLPECFVCGTQRASDGGMRIHPGALSGGMFAATWIPESSLCDSAGRAFPQFIWSALDCPGGFAANPGSDFILLGELCARVEGTASAGERCVVIGWPLGADGRKRFAGSAVFSESGRLIGVARATWIQIVQPGQ